VIESSRPSPIVTIATIARDDVPRCVSSLREMIAMIAMIQRMTIASNFF
jgi:hypothetical protein